MERLVIDLTSYKETFDSFMRSFSLSDSDVHTMDEYFLTHERDEISTDHFLTFLGRKSAPIQTQPLQLNSLHVTTNNDQCSSILKLGIRDLQANFTEDTAMSEHFRRFGIEIKVKEKMLISNGKEFSLQSTTYKDVNYNEALNHVVYKLYKDSAVCGFVSSNNVLNYQGGIRSRPEFINNLSIFLQCPELVSDWENANSTYVVKFGLPFEAYQELNTSMSIESILFQVIYEYVNNNGPSFEIYSFLPQFSNVQPNQIIAIYSDKEYLNI